MTLLKSSELLGVLVGTWSLEFVAFVCSQFPSSTWCRVCWQVLGKLDSESEL